MEPLSVLRPLVTIVLSVARFAVGVWLFTAPLPLRDKAQRRVPVALLGITALYSGLLVLFISGSSRLDPVRYAFGEFFAFSILLVGLVLATTYVYDTNILTAVFCCSSGYAVQNLASGLTELVLDLTLSGADKAVAYTSVDHHAIMLVSALAIFTATYFLVTKPLLRQGLRQVDDPWMLSMMVVVIAVIIGFDLLIKGLVADGLDVRAMVLLRAFHGIACVFTLGAGLQLLVVRLVKAERDAAWEVLAERERQYEASRENVEAINARVHDIRHAIGRLADNAQVDRDVLASMVREIDVYGKSLRTGNAALDTILAEKGLVCAREGIALSCVADGSLLSGIAPGDIYALFSTLLDEAVARTSALPDGRSVSLTIKEALGSVAVHLECTQVGGTGAADEARLAPLQALCDRYGATLATMAEGDTWHANALFPQLDEVD